jgi:hypothetical protein
MGKHEDDEAERQTTDGQVDERRPQPERTETETETAQ